MIIDYGPLASEVEELIEKGNILASTKSYNVEEPDGFRLAFSWKLEPDPERPKKLSRILLVTITYDALENFLDAGKEYRPGMIETMKRFLSAGMEEFDPDHDESDDAPPPNMKIDITGNELIDD